MDAVRMVPSLDAGVLDGHVGLCRLASSSVSGCCLIVGSFLVVGCSHSAHTGVWSAGTLIGLDVICNGRNGIQPTR